MPLSFFVPDKAGGGGGEGEEDGIVSGDKTRLTPSKAGRMKVEGGGRLHAHHPRRSARLRYRTLT